MTEVLKTISLVDGRVYVERLKSFHLWTSI